MSSPSRLFATASLAVRLAQSTYGTAQPQMDVRFPRSTHHRAVSAALHQIASILELATPERESWCVQLEHAGDTVGWVYLELADGSDDEARRGMALLEAIRLQVLGS